MDNDTDFDFCVDTALSWDGRFPKVGDGDYIVHVASEDDDATVLVSRRYTEADSAEDAAEIALDAFCERRGIEEGAARVVSCERVTEDEEEDNDDGQG